MSDGFSESIQRWMRQGDILSERGVRAAEDLSDLDEVLAPALRARARRAASVRRWLSVAVAVVVGSLAALWVTHALSPSPARSVLTVPAASRTVTPTAAATTTAPAVAPALTAVASAPSSPVVASRGKAGASSRSRAPQPHRRSAAVAATNHRHHRR